MSLPLVTVANLSLRLSIYSTIVVTSRVEERVLRRSAPFDPDSRLRGDRRRGIRRAHRACAPEGCLHQLQETPDAHRYPQDGADAGRAGDAKVLARVVRVAVAAVGALVGGKRRGTRGVRAIPVVPVGMAGIFRGPDVR